VYREPQELLTRVVAAEVVDTPVAPETKKAAALAALVLLLFLIHQQVLI
jgi:hypothetical protein